MQVAGRAGRDRAKAVISVYFHTKDFLSAVKLISYSIFAKNAEGDVVVKTIHNLNEKFQKCLQLLWFYADPFLCKRSTIMKAFALQSSERSKAVWQNCSMLGGETCSTCEDHALGFYVIQGKSFTKDTLEREISKCMETILTTLNEANDHEIKWGEASKLFWSSQIICSALGRLVGFRKIYIYPLISLNLGRMQSIKIKLI